MALKSSVRSKIYWLITKIRIETEKKPTFSIASDEFHIVGSDLILLAGRLAKFDLFEEQSPNIVAESIGIESAFETVAGLNSAC